MEETLEWVNDPQDGAHCWRPPHGPGLTTLNGNYARVFLNATDSLDNGIKVQHVLNDTVKRDGLIIGALVHPAKEGSVLHQRYG